MTREEFNEKKAWLWRYQRSRNYERQLCQQILNEQERATATTKALSPVVVSAGGNSSKIETAVCMMAERKEQLSEQIIKTEMVRLEIEKAIEDVKDDMQRDVLRERYIVGTPYWWKIAINLNISERWAKKLHRAAVENLCTPVHF